jgi:hypothetical protein
MQSFCLAKSRFFSSTGLASARPVYLLRTIRHDTVKQQAARIGPYSCLRNMSGHASGAGAKVALTLWVHDASQAPGTQQKVPERPLYGVPLANSLSSEIVLSPELLKNETLDVEVGDVVELFKATAGAAGTLHGSNSTSSWAGDSSQYTPYKAHHKRNSNAGNARDASGSESLVFRIERSSLASEGSSGQLQVSHRNRKQTVWAPSYHISLTH